jgi:hypothetical protein
MAAAVSTSGWLWMGAILMSAFVVLFNRYVNLPRVPLTPVPMQGTGYTPAVGPDQSNQIGTINGNVVQARDIDSVTFNQTINNYDTSEGTSERDSD